MCGKAWTKHFRSILNRCQVDSDTYGAKVGSQASLDTFDYCHQVCASVMPLRTVLTSNSAPMSFFTSTDAGITLNR